MIRTIIIEDEPNNREMLLRLLHENCPNVSVVADAESVRTGVDVILRFHPDLVLLDIKMEDGDAFDLLEQLENIDFKIIFITAFEEYALKAFKFSAVDYLLKPVNAEELIKAIDKVDDQILKDLKLQLSALSNNLKSHESNTIVLKTAENIHLVNVHEIIRCEADRSYTLFFLTNSKKIIISRPLKEVDELLKHQGFFRVHQSHLVNLSFIERFKKSEGGYVILKDSSQIPVAQRKRDLLLEVFNNL